MEDGGFWSEVPVWLGVATLVVAIGGLYVAARAYILAVVSRREDKLRAEASKREDAAEALRRNAWRERYDRGLAEALGWLGQQYGKPWGARAWLVSILLSAAYAYLTFCWTWAFGWSDGELLGQQLMPDWQGPARWVGGALMGVMPPGLFLLLRWASPRLMRWQEAREAAWAAAGLRYRKWGLRIAMGLTPGGLILLADYLPDGEVDALAIAVAGAFAGAGAGDNNRQNTIGLSIPLMIALLGFLLLYAAIGLVVGGVSDATIVFVGFFGVLPIANGLADGLSLWVSRRLGEDLLKGTQRSNPWHLVFTFRWHIVVDIAAAAALLLFLAGFLALLMQGIGTVRGIPFDVAGEIERAAGDLPGQGVWFSAMLLTTLLPTFAHLVALAASVLVVTGPDEATRQNWANRIERGGFDQHNADDQRLADSIARWQTYHLGLVPALLGLITIGAFLWVLWQAFGSTFTGWITQAAHIGVWLGGG
jgi:hypothetical protein